MRSVKKSRRTSNNLSRRRDKGRRDKRRKTRKKSTKRKSSRRRRTRRRIKHMMRGGGIKISGTISFPMDSAHEADLDHIIFRERLPVTLSRKARARKPTEEFHRAFREAMAERMEISNLDPRLGDASLSIDDIDEGAVVPSVHVLGKPRFGARVHWNMLLPASALKEPAQAPGTETGAETGQAASGTGAETGQAVAAGKAEMEAAQERILSRTRDDLVVGFIKDGEKREFKGLMDKIQITELKYINDMALAQMIKGEAEVEVARGKHLAGVKGAAEDMSAAQAQVDAVEKTADNQRAHLAERAARDEEGPVGAGEDARAVVGLSAVGHLAAQNLKDYFEDDVKKLQNISDPEVLRRATLQTGHPDAKYQFAIQTSAALKLLSEKLKEVVVPPSELRNTKLEDHVRLGYGKKIFHRIRTMDSILLLNLSPQFTYFLAELSELLGDKVLSHYAGGLVANGFPQWLMESQEGNESHNKTLFRVIYETLKDVISQLGSMVDTFDLMMARIIQESKPFLQVKQLAQEGISALTLGGSFGGSAEMPVLGGIGGSASIPNVPVGLLAASSLEGSEHLDSLDYYTKIRGNFSKEKDAIFKNNGAIFGELAAQRGMALKSFIDQITLTDKFSPEAVNFNTYFKNLRDLLFSQAATVSKYLYNLEIINSSVQFKEHAPEDEELLNSLWASYKTMAPAGAPVPAPAPAPPVAAADPPVVADPPAADAPADASADAPAGAAAAPAAPEPAGEQSQYNMYHMITHLCDACKESINDNIEGNIEKRMDLLMAHPPIQQTFRSASEDVSKHGGLGISKPDKVLGNMLPLNSISLSVGDSRDNSVSESASSQFDYNKDGEKVLEGEGAEKSKGTSEGHNTSSSTNVVNVPAAFEEHLRLESRADFDKVNAKVTKAQQPPTDDE